MVHHALIGILPTLVFVPMALLGLDVRALWIGVAKVCARMEPNVNKWPMTIPATVTLPGPDSGVIFCLFPVPPLPRFGMWKLLVCVKMVERAVTPAIHTCASVGVGLRGHTVSGRSMNVPLTRVKMAPVALI